MDTDRSVPKRIDCMKAAKSFIGVFEGHKPCRSRANSVPFRSICGGSIMESNESKMSYGGRERVPLEMKVWKSSQSGA